MAHIYQLSSYCHNGAGNFFQNTWHFELSEAGSGISPFNYADALISSWITNTEPKLVDCFGSDVVVDYYASKKVTGGGGPAATRASGTVGLGSTICASAGSAADLCWQTASPLNRPGHSYMAGFPYSFLQGDAFTNTALTKYTAFINQMLSVLTLAGALGSATFQIYTRKTASGFTVDSGSLRPKATMMNRRLVPQI